MVEMKCIHPVIQGGLRGLRSITGQTWDTEMYKMKVYRGPAIE